MDEHVHVAHHDKMVAPMDDKLTNVDQSLIMPYDVTGSQWAS